jgi:transcriptional regulator with XRE-family HTH domain
MSRPAINIGERLKAARMARGLSQRQLARKAGVTNGLISQIEQNHSSPSIASLKRITDALPLSLADFFADDFVPPSPVFFRADDQPKLDPRRIFRGSAVSGDICPRQAGAGNGLRMLQVRYDPGADTGMVRYAPQGEEVGIVISGRIEVTVGEETAELGPGDAYQFDSSIPHRFRNLGDGACILVSAASTPVSYGRLSV